MRDVFLIVYCNRNCNTLFEFCQVRCSRIYKFLLGGEQMNIRERLKALGKTQNWLIIEMKKRGVSVITSEFSNILSGVLTTPKATKVLALCDEILTICESEAKNDA